MSISLTAQPVYSKTPVTSGEKGIQGQMYFDTNYLYICVSTNVWKRIALVSF